MLTSLLADLASSDEGRAEAASSELSRTGASAVDGLLGLLKTQAPEARWWTVRTLAAIPDDRSSQALAQALHDPDRMVRQAAALGLRLQPRAEAAPTLAALLSDPDPLLSRLAGDALTALGVPALDPLRRALRGPSPAARIQAARAMSQMKARQAIPDLFAALEDGSALVRHWAERGLDDLGVGLTYFFPD